MTKINKKEPKNEVTPVLIGASLLMEEVFESGLYREMKTAETKLESIKGTIRKQFEDGESKRYELPQNLVAKFVPFPTYETDELGLKEFLDDYGVLTQVATLKATTFKEKPELLKQLKPFQRPKEYFAQFYLNSAGKAHIDREVYTYSDNLDQLAFNFVSEYRNFEESRSRYKKYMQDIENCPFLRVSKSMKSNFGTCKLREKVIEFNTHSVYNELGNDFLIKYSQISMNAIEEYIAKGYFYSKEINSFRKMIDYNLRFVVMDKETEARQAEFFHKQTMRKAQMRRFA